MGNEVSITLSDIRGGAVVVQARLRAGASPNKRMLFTEDVGALPRGCKCTPLGYAILSRDMPLLGVLLEAGADLKKPVGLPHRFDLTPLHLAAALGKADIVLQLLARRADPNAPLALKRGTTAPSPSPLQRSSDGGGVLPVNLSFTRAGDGPLHVAIDCSAETGSGATEVVEALIAHPSTDPNLPNARRRTPLYKACKRQVAACAALLATHPRVDVNAGGPLFAAIMVQSTELVRMMLQAGARAGGPGIRNDDGQSPLRYTLHRVSVFFHNRAEIVTLLVNAGAVVEADMLPYAEQRNWRRVHAALAAGVRNPRGGGSSDGAASGGGGGGGVGASGGVRLGDGPGRRASSIWGTGAPQMGPFTRAGLSYSESATASPLSSYWGLSRLTSPRWRSPAVGAGSGAAAAVAAAGGDGRDISPSAPDSQQPGDSSESRRDATSDHLCARVFSPVMFPFHLAEGVASFFSSLRNVLDRLFYMFVAMMTLVLPILLFVLYQIVCRVVPFLKSSDTQDSATGDIAREALSARQVKSGPDGAAPPSVHPAEPPPVGDLAQHLGEQPLSYAAGSAPVNGSPAAAAAAATTRLKDVASWAASPPLPSPPPQPPNGAAALLAPLAPHADGADTQRGHYRHHHHVEGLLEDSGKVAAEAAGSPAFSLLLLLWQACVCFFVALAAVFGGMLVACVLLDVGEAALVALLPRGLQLRAFLEHRVMQRGRAQTSAGRSDMSYVSYYVPVVLGVRWATGTPLWVLTALLAVCFTAHQALGEYSAYEEYRSSGGGSGGAQSRSHGERVAQAREDWREGGSEPEPLEGVGAGPVEGATGGLGGLCCVCMTHRAVIGFVHRDVVHCCLCEDCEGEVRRRGQLGRCLICKQRAASVIKVVAT